MSALAGRLAEALRLMIERAACEVESLHELGRDDDDTAVESMVAKSELDTARAALAAWEASNPARFDTDPSMAAFGPYTVAKVDRDAPVIIATR
jgi:hypothetical protein